MNSISVPTEIDKNTDTAAMELTIGNMNLRISNETDPLLLAKTIQILAELFILGDITAAGELYIVTG